MITRILVLGGGSAGFLAALTVKYRNPQLQVLVLRSKDIGIIGVGEGTTLPVVSHLHEYLRVDPAEFHKIAQPTWKMGVRFLTWGPRRHFDYALGTQFDLRLPGLSKGPAYYCQDVTLTADLYVDASGFRSVLLGQTLGEPFRSFKPSLFDDRAVVGGWDRTDEPIKSYTTAETMNAGWCWQIEHEHRINRGYVYSSDFIADDEAEREFRAKNPKVSATRVVKFITGRYERPWVKNVVAIGNSSGFVEPLESTSLGVICLDSFALAETLADCDLVVRPTQVRLYNRRSAISWDVIRSFLAIHFKFNTRLEMPYWRACVQDADLCEAEEYVQYYRENGPSTLWRGLVLEPRNPFGIEGYLSMMVGMNVPYHKTYTPAPQEMQVWNDIYRRLQSAAREAVTVKEALDCLRQPSWQWPANLYKTA